MSQGERGPMKIVILEITVGILHINNKVNTH